MAQGPSIHLYNGGFMMISWTKLGKISFLTKKGRGYNPHNPSFRCPPLSSLPYTSFLFTNYSGALPYGKNFCVKIFV